MTWAPRCLARMMQTVPTPPLAPRTSTRSPALTVPWVMSMRCAVPYATGSAAAASKLTPAGMAMSWSAATQQYSAMPPSSISPMRPFALLSGLTSTRSPTFQPLTPFPTSAISPAMSRPITTGSGTLMPGMPRTVDIRHIATLVDQADTALYFHDVIGYHMPVVSGLIRTRERSIMAMGCETYREIEDKLAHAINHPIAPKYVKTSPTRELAVVGDEVDLYKLPIPMSSIFDGGPMITAGVVIARDPELGINSGIYRFIVKEKSLTGIDIVTPNNMRLFAQRAYENGRPLPISISIGTHPIEITGSGYRAPLGVDEMAIAGGLRGAPVELAPCETIDLPFIADAEIVRSEEHTSELQ